MKTHLTLRSSNSKTGPIPVSTSERSTCPPSCPHFESSCYAETGPLRLHWDKIEERGVDWLAFCSAIAALPDGQIWRHNQAGDLPGNGKRIDSPALMLLVEANLNKRGFTYTHYDPEVADNAYWIAVANALGFTINLSADTPAQADALADLGIGPVVLTVASDHAGTHNLDSGRTLALCPATTTEGVSCQTCRICATQHKAVIAFPAHGSRRRVIDISVEAEA